MTMFTAVCTTKSAKVQGLPLNTAPSAECRVTDDSLDLGVLILHFFM